MKKLWAGPGAGDKALGPFIWRDRPTLRRISNIPANRGSIAWDGMEVNTYEGMMSMPWSRRVCQRTRRCSLATFCSSSAEILPAQYASLAFFLSEMKRPGQNKLGGERDEKRNMHSHLPLRAHSGVSEGGGRRHVLCMCGGVKAGKGSGGTSEALAPATFFFSFSLVCGKHVGPSYDDELAGKRDEDSLPGCGTGGRLAD